jgi:cell fate regulator YaaT (PSP1 superfamily)
MDEVDAGWDDSPSAGAREVQAREREPAAWGDDSEAPTPEVALAPDLPPDPPADDPDPASAHWLDLPDPEPATEHGAVRNPIGIKFNSAGKIYLFDAGDDSYRAGEEVVVDTERGPRLAVVAVAPLRSEVTRGPLRRVLRRPGRNDLRNLEKNHERDLEVLRTAREIARELDLPIKVFRSELSLGGGKAVVYFSTDDKIDTRRLARELNQRIHLRIELRQTGVRDEAKMVGGIGSCGQELCCTTWLPAFVPVSIKNAKDQGLVLNPTKVSGQCGRLKCCLVYEQETYAELRKGLPKLGKRVVTGAGEGRVVEVDVLRQRVRVSLVHGEIQVFTADEVRPMFPSQSGAPRTSTDDDAS